MDILISSNLERLLYHLTDGDDRQISEWFGKLAKDGKYEVTDAVKAKIKELFYAGCCDDEATKGAIKQAFDEYSYLMDTHTGVAYKVYNDYRAATGDETKTIIASTANPYKFGKAVYEAVGGDTAGIDEFTIIDKLEQRTGTSMPAPLAATKTKTVRFTGSVDKSGMSKVVLDFLKSR